MTTDLADLLNALNTLNDTMKSGFMDVSAKLSDLKECLEAEGGAITKNQNEMYDAADNGIAAMKKGLQEVQLLLRAKSPDLTRASESP